MKRREFITLLGGAAVWSVTASAQHSGVPVVGFLNSAFAWENAPFTDAFLRGLSETGYVEGRNVQIEYRWAEGHYERLPLMAADLVRQGVNVIAAMGTPTAPAAKAATSTIPIVFRIAVDPVELGLVASLARPGGNLTGAVSLNVELEPKRLELLQEVVPTAKVVAALVNPSSPNVETQSRSLQAAARALGLQLHVLQASTELDFAKVFATLTDLKPGGLVIVGDPFFLARREQLAALALQYEVPTVAFFREFVMAGALMAYGGSNSESYHVAGTYTGRILKGEKPADLPVQQSAKVELIINLKTAKALGLTLPLSLLGRADEVIE